ncbi:hypothetical protein [Burkholderia plantarii]|uniref:hypothetical protein n=1 Tax=Burkholderia plantarii TaxID=41899 RepID=UPI0018DB8DF3|nr:hypothetical protein [Burkholderia plantarii]MBI0328541.1 hypothetical protein [Burkholderia plantarii]
MKKFSLVLLFPSLLAGCAMSFGPGEGTDKLADASQQSLQSEFALGVASRDDVASKLGAPDSKTTAGSFDIWTYRYVRRAAVALVVVATPVGTTKTATFYFDDKTGLLKRVEFESHHG